MLYVSVEIKLVRTAGHRRKPLPAQFGSQEGGIFEEAGAFRSRDPSYELNARIHLLYLCALQSLP
jgi:hypothetical protein